MNKIFFCRYTPTYSYTKITPGYLPPAKVAISAPAYTINTPAYSSGNYHNGYSNSLSYDASLYSKGGYYSAPVQKYISTPTAAPIACEYLLLLISPDICRYLCSEFIFTQKSFGI